MGVVGHAMAWPNILAIAFSDHVIKHSKEYPGTIVINQIC